MKQWSRDSSVLILLTLSLVGRALADIDYSICNPLIHPSGFPSPMPELAKSFTANIEWKWLDRNLTVDVTEVENGLLRVASQVIEMEGQVTKVILDHVEQQYITYSKKEGCTVKGLGSLAFLKDQLWLSSTNMLYRIVKLAGPQQNLTTMKIRSTEVKRWRACLDIFQLNTTAEIDIYFSVYGWGMALSPPDALVPVRIEIRGSKNYVNGSANNASTGFSTFHVVGDYVDYNPIPTLDVSQLQLPAGVYCPGKASQKPLELFPESFSLVMETVDQDFHTVTYEYIWYDAVHRLIRRDTKQATNQDLDPQAEIFDFNVGTHYIIDKYMGNCEPAGVLDLGDLYVVAMGNNSRMASSLEFFHAKNAQYQYVGERTTRGVSCDVWVGIYLDETSGTNFTIEWYFTQSDWETAIGGVIQSQTLFRMDIWEGGSNKPIVKNVLQLDKDTPSLNVFDISPCYTAQQKSRVLIHFSVKNSGRLSTVGMSYLTDVVHASLVQALIIPPLRLTQVSVFIDGETELYVDAILLDKAPKENKKLVPPPPDQHPLSGVLDFLNGLVLSRFAISLNSTIDKTPVIIESRDFQIIDYSKRFSTTSTVSTHSTTEATPPQPTTSVATPPIETPPTLKPTTPDVSPNCPTQQRCPAMTCPPTNSQCPKCPSCSILTTSKCPICPAIAKCTTPQPKTPMATPSIETPPTLKPTTPDVPPTLPPLTSQQTPCPQCTCTKSMCPKAATCKPQPPCPSQGTTVTPSPTVHIPKPSELTGKQSENSKGLSGGAVAGIALGMLILGLFIGVAAIRGYQLYRMSTGNERKNILDNYLNDEERY